MAKGTSRTAVFYQTHPRSRQKHSDDNNSGKGGKYAHSKKYKRDHMRARRRLKIAKGMDYEKNTGRARPPAANRGDHT